MYARKVFVPNGGIPKERIIKCPGNPNEYLKRLECSICKNILFIPRECSQCKSKVCLSCLEIYDDMKEKLPQQPALTRVPQELLLQNCPGKASCKGGQFNEVEEAQMEFMETMFNLLEFKCHNEECKEVLKYSDLNSHECNFDEFICKATDCSIKFYRNDDHESKCKKVPLECEYRANGCKLTIHKKECDFQFLICDKCGLPDILKKDMGRHLEDCTKENTICERCNAKLLREELKMHNCSQYMTQQISLMQESIARIEENHADEIVSLESMISSQGTMITSQDNKITALKSIIESFKPQIEKLEEQRKQLVEEEKKQKQLEKERKLSKAMELDIKELEVKSINGQDIPRLRYQDISTQIYEYPRLCRRDLYTRYLFIIDSL